MIPGGILPGVRRIAVFRANQIGDYLLAVPALEALRAAYPSAEIVLLGARWHAEFLRDRPGPVDRVVPVPPVPELCPGSAEPTDPAEVDAFLDRMRAERFDLALQLHGGGRHSNPLVAALGARCTVGLRAADAPPLDLTLPYVIFQPEVLRYLEVVGLVGATPATLVPRVTLLDRDEAEADTALAGLAGPFAALHPGASDPRRRWPAESFATVGDALADAGATVLVTGSGGERATVGEVVDRMRAPALPLVDAASVGGLGAVYHRCAVLVSNDTGPRHLAEAVGTGTVGIYWGANLVTAGPLTRARHRAHVSWMTACPTCGRDVTTAEEPAPRGPDRCPHEVPWVSSVAPAAVLADALDLLGGADRSHGLDPALTGT